MFPLELVRVRGAVQPRKMCPYHLEMAKKNQKSAKRKAYMREYNASAKCKAIQKAHAQTEHAKATKRRWKKSEKGKQCARRANKTAAGRLRQKRKDAKQHAKRAADPARKMMHTVACRVREMLRIGRVDSSTVVSCTNITSGDELRAHLESTFEDGMSWQNHGHRGKNVWNIGHRIAAAMYDAGNDEDLRRCWSLENIFAQWSVANQLAGVKLPSDAELLNLRAFWPTSWASVPTAEERHFLETRARNAFGRASLSPRAGCVA